MTARFWTNVGRLIGIGLLLAALVPALASAASFQRVGPAPGGDDLAVINGVPHVAYATGGGVRVSKLTTGNVWVQVGGAIRHTNGAAVSSPSLTSDANGVPWIVWLERDSGGINQARVAKFTNGSWQEVVGGAKPINTDYGHPDEGPLSAFDPQIAIVNGRPYVVYIQDSPVEFILEAVRLNDAGTAWQHVAPQSHGRPAHPRIALSGGRLYLAVEDALVPGFYMYRLNSAGTGWEGLGNGTDIYQQVGDIADVGGSPVIGYSAERTEDPQGTELRAQVLESNGQWTQLGAAAFSSGDYSTVDPQGVAGDGDVPYVSGLFGSDLAISRFVDGGWEPIDSPSANATSALLQPGSTGGVWLLFGESSGGTTTYYLATLGATLPAGDDPNPGPGPGPSPGPPEPTPQPTGHCVKTINGTAAADRLTGTHLGDSLFGFGGNDTLIAYAGSDCLYGASGNDYLSGGKGNDFFSGGSGNDRLSGGDGQDDLNGNAGNDVISGGRGEDAIAAGSGNDRVDVTQQGADLVDCGPGRDTVVITPIDGYRNCEKVIIRR
jgi:hypothetical protein